MRRISCQLLSDLGLKSPLSGAVELADDALTALLNLELTISPDYYTAFRHRNAPVYRMTAREYLDRDTLTWHGAVLLCPEMPLPQGVAAEVRFRASMKTCTKHALALIHAGKPGSIAPVHFDWDHSWVAHACITGTKRMFFFPPNAGWLLSPVINTSAFCVPRFSEVDRRRFLDRLGGVEVVLRAGEGVLFPSMFWHGVLYDEASLSVSVRFEGNFGGRPYAALPRSWWLQRVAWNFFQQGYGEASEEFLMKYLKSFFAAGVSWKERYRQTTALCRVVLKEQGEHFGVDGLVGENFAPELALTRTELKRFYGSYGQTCEDNPVSELKTVEDYLFEGIHRPDACRGGDLANYAFRLRQGLPPQRGWIKIVQ